MKKKKTIAIIGAGGAVGREIVRLLIERDFSFDHLRLFGNRSIGQTIASFPIEKLETLEGIDLAFFCAGSNVSKEWIPKTKCLCIDSSSAFRAQYPLIIPEINAHRAVGKILCSPNCAATILLMPLFPLHRKFGAKRIILSTYQAASGGGAQLLEHLKKETLANLENRLISPIFSFPYAFNLYPHNSSLHPNGYVEEEMKIAFETQKILEDETIALSATCIRVPVLRAHSISVNVEFRTRISLNEIYETLQDVPGLKIFEDRTCNRFATPFDATEKNEVFCGRFRLDPTQANTLEFWVVADQLLKGAALNAVQIAELDTTSAF